MTLVGTGGGSYQGSGVNNYGVYLNTATLTAGNGGTAPNTINITGIGGVGTGTGTLSKGNQNGVELEGTIIFNLNGTSGYNAINFINCVGGAGPAGQNYGLNFDASLTQLSGAITFQNIVGGGTHSSSNNHGVMMQANQSFVAPVILMTDILGGAGGNTNIGLYNNGGTFGGAGAKIMTISAGSLGTGVGNVGIQVDTSGQMVVGDGGLMTLAGTGGGFYSTGGSNNFGVYFKGATLTAGNGGALTNTIDVMGIGGTGTGGSNVGVEIDTLPLNINLNGTSGANSISFSNTIGGSGGNNNIGMNIDAAINMVSGLMKLSNITGGSGTSGNYGVLVNPGITLSLANVIATDIYGGAGVGSATYNANNQWQGDVGFYVNGGTLGGATTRIVSITAGSLGTGSGEVGILVDQSGHLMTGDGGAITLIGSGGGAYNSGGSKNYGVYFNGATLSAGNGGNALNMMTVTGIGGTSGGGSNVGVEIDTNPLNINLNGTNNGNNLNFSNTIGGTGAGGGNIGLNFNAPVNMVSGLMTLSNITGGTLGTGNYGVLVNVGISLSLANVIATDIYGGAGVGSASYVGGQWQGSVGFYVNGGTLGGTTTRIVSITAGSLGTGSGEAGIVIDDHHNLGTYGSIVTGDGGTITLVGAGGGNYSGAGGSNYGVYFSGATLTAGNGGAAVNTMTVTGVGGTGTLGNNVGVQIDAAAIAGSTLNVNLNGTNPANILNFSNTVGGTGAGGGNIGLNFDAPLNMVSGVLGLINITGGSLGANNHGVLVNTGIVLALSNVIGTDLEGGPGTSSTIGFYNNGGTVGSATTRLISITAGSLGTLSNAIGIKVDTNGQMIVGDGGTMTLIGTGGGIYSNAGTATTAFS